MKLEIDKTILARAISLVCEKNNIKRDMKEIAKRLQDDSYCYNAIGLGEVSMTYWLLKIGRMKWPRSS